jgi:predicted aspartyl protease
MLNRNRLVTFAFFFACSVAALAKPTEGALRFDLYRGYLVVVHGSAGPLKGLNFLLDTGTNPSMLDKRIAAKLHLERTPANVRVVGGNVQAERAVAPELVLGPVERSGVPVFVADLSFFQDALPVPIDGVIGLDTLGDTAFLIDYVAREIHFGALPVMPYSLPLHATGGLAVVSAEVNSIPRRLLVDTGASSLTLFAPNDAAARAVKVSERIGQFTHKDVTLHSVKLGSTDFGPEQASVVVGEWQGYAFDGLVSPAMLGMRRVSFDLGRGVLGFSR